MKALRVGILGAARIAPTALIEPARHLDNVIVGAVAARDAARAQAFASRHGIPNVHASYEALLADPDIDAIYNPLPNSLHGYWTIAALEAGKHVLCEKPFSANADEAERVAAVTRRTGLVTMEAFHYRYHRLMQIMLDVIASGELGAVRHIETWMCIPLVVDDIRWRYALGGGTLMDVGSYSIHCLRTLAGAEPTLRSARTWRKSADVDRLTKAEFNFADGRTGSIVASMLSSRLLDIGARVVGAYGEMKCFNFVAPQYQTRLTVKTKAGVRRIPVERQPSSYLAQLRVFADAVLHGGDYVTDVDDAIANMRVIDSVYDAVGLKRRQPSRP